LRKQFETGRFCIHCRIDEDMERVGLLLGAIALGAKPRSRRDPLIISD